MAAMIEVVCANPSCKIKFQARVADRARGWGLYHNKRCKAIVQDRNRQNHRLVVHKMQNTDFYCESFPQFAEGWDEHKGEW